MSDPFGPGSLSWTQHHVLALRLVVSKGRSVRGEVVDPESKRGRSFRGLTELCTVIAECVSDYERAASVHEASPVAETALPSRARRTDRESME